MGRGQDLGQHRGYQGLEGDAWCAEVVQQRRRQAVVVHGTQGQDSKLQGEGGREGGRGAHERE